MATAALLQTDRWHSSIAAAVLGNLRVTDRGGFGAPCVPFETIVAGGGWAKVFDSTGTPQYSPHYQSYIWAVYLWAHAQSGFAPLYDRAQVPTKNNTRIRLDLLGITYSA